MARGVACDACGEIRQKKWEKGMDAKERTGAPAPRVPRARSAEQTRTTILRAAIAEFASEGYGGARVDRISRAAGSNDRMLYYYFGSKEALFRCVIEQCYADLVAEEEALDIELSRPVDALAAIVAFNWDYYWRHPELLSILNSENLFEGRHVKEKISDTFARTQLSLLGEILETGINRGEFNSDCDPLFVYMTILSLTYFYRSNLHTLSSYLNVDLADSERRSAWLAHVQRVVRTLVSPGRL
jgi:TetR/AcrR family transcriptional regulator, upper aerobic nicotinate degradation pathway regulator